jgi:hypothetical protein
MAPHKRAQEGQRPPDVEQRLYQRAVQLGQTHQQSAVLLRRRERTAGRLWAGDRRRADAQQRRTVLSAE